MFLTRPLNLILVVAAMHCMPLRAANDPVEHYTLPENAHLQRPFSEAVRVGNTVYLAGQIGIPPGANALVAGGIGPESEQTLENIGLILRHFNLSFADIVKCQVMLLDIADWPAFNAVYKNFMTAPYPARSALAASGLAFNARVELECMAVIPDAVGKAAKP